MQDAELPDTASPAGWSAHDGARRLSVEPLTAAAFAPFGDVIDAGSGTPYRTINAGRARRYDDLARVDTTRDGGRTLVSIFRTGGVTLPRRLDWVERHQLGSQAFIPLHSARMLVVVAPAGTAPAVDALRCFLGAPGQGVNYAAGTWHHPLIVLDGDTGNDADNHADVLVIDRGATESDCDEHRFGDVAVWLVA